MGIYLNRWEGYGFAQVVADFEGIYKESEAAAAMESEKYKGVDVLFASYGGGAYEGDAFVLFRRDGRLYEVNGSHCSCYGLEDQWEPEETSKAALEKRMTDGRLGSHGWGEESFTDELREVLAAIPEEA